MPGCALVLYARVPRRGAVKTRMTPWLKIDQALALHVALVEDSAALLMRAAQAAGARPYIAFSEAWAPDGVPGCAGITRAAADAEPLPQKGADLGERLRHSFAELFGRGHDGVVVFGSDSPTLPPQQLNRACAALRSGADLVLGPTDDGGYYLVGLPRPLDRLFEGIPWGSDRVFEATLRAAERLGASPTILPRWYDIDRPKDLTRLLAGRGGRPPAGAERTSEWLSGLIESGRVPPPAR